MAFREIAGLLRDEGSAGLMLPIVEVHITLFPKGCRKNRRLSCMLLLVFTCTDE
jgi:hypothetical protein